MRLKAILLKKSAAAPKSVSEAAAYKKNTGECPKETPKLMAKLIAEQQTKRKAKRRKRITAAIAVLGTAAVAIGFYFLTTELLLPPVNYKKGKAALTSGNYRDALVYFDKADGYADAVEQSKPLRRQFAPCPTVAAGAYHTIAVRNDGTVAAVGADTDPWTGQYIGQCDVESWTDIIAVAAGWDHTVGLKADGTVVAVGDNEYGQCNVENWEGIISVAASSSSTIGLKADGMVVAVGDNHFGQCNVENWKGIIAVAAGDEHTAGLKSDGTVVATGNNKVIVNRNLKYYVTQLAALLCPTIRGDTGPCEVNNWENIIAVAAGNEYTIGLKSDGTVVTAGPDRYELNTVDNLKNIVAVASGNFNTLALKANGNLLAYGPNDYGQSMVYKMDNIVSMTAGVLHTVGIRSDGTAVAAGNNDFGQCNVDDWKDIRLPGHN